MIQPTISPIEDASLELEKRLRNKNHIVVFSADGNVEIDIYKYKKGDYCVTWLGADKTRHRKTTKDRAKALNLAKEICAKSWQLNGFGRYEDCRVLISEPARTTLVRTRNLFDKIQIPGEFKKFVPQKFGWRTLLRRVISSELTPAQKLVLLYAYDRGFQSGEFFAASATTENDLRINHDHVQRIARKLDKIGFFNRIGIVEGTRGAIRYALCWPDVWTTDTDDFKSPVTQDAGDLDLPLVATLRRGSGDLTSPKANTTNRSETSRASTRVLAPDGEQKLFEAIKSVVGAEEMKKNRAMWLKRIRGGRREIKALRYTVEDYLAKTPDQKSKIRNRGAWFTDHYLRELTKIQEPQAAS